MSKAEKVASQITESLIASWDYGEADAKDSPKNIDLGKQWRECTQGEKEHIAQLIYEDILETIIQTYGDHE